MSGFQKFFASTKVMLVSFIIAFAGYGARIGLCGSMLTVEPQLYSASMGEAILIFFIILGMYRTYCKHETGALNNLTGAVIAIFVFTAIQNVAYAIGYLSQGYYMFIATAVICAVALALYVILFVNHVNINMLHRSSKSRIGLNQIVLIILAAYQVVELVFLFINISMGLYSDSAVQMGVVNAAIPELIARIFVIFMIVCIETQLNAYKTERENAEAEGRWTEEKKAETKKKYFGS